MSSVPGASRRYLFLHLCVDAQCCRIELCCLLVVSERQTPVQLSIAVCSRLFSSSCAQVVKMFIAHGGVGIDDDVS